MTVPGRMDVPSYDDLPVDPTKPAGSSWGVFGPEDEVGTLNRIGPQEVARAARLVASGLVFPLNWEVDKPSPPVFGRREPVHHVYLGDTSTDDYYDSFYPQGSSQWDALCHIRHPEHGYYNGVDPALTPGGGGTRLGIQSWARRGIAGRFVLADVARHRERRGDPIDFSVRTPVSCRELDEVLAVQGVVPAPGDVLLLRFGWTEWYDGLDLEGRERFASGDDFASPGIEAGRETERWLWDHGFAAVAADSPAVEATPFDTSTESSFLHFGAIALLGLALGELFSLGGLAEHCDDVGDYEGLFVAAPMNSVGGSGSPANAVALM